MSYSFSIKKIWHIKRLLCIPVLCISINAIAQVRWDGEAGDGQWSTAANWAGNIVPVSTDDVLLDNSIVAGNYTLLLPGSSVAVIIKTITISPAASNTIQFILPVSNTAIPAFTATGPAYGITINNGGIFMNSSGSASTAAILVNDSFRINNGGQYIHNTRSAHAAIVTALSKQPGTESGVFKFDTPGGGYTFASTNRTYGTLILSADASGGSQSYTTSAASPLTINGDFILQAGVTVSLDLTAATIIKGNYIQEGGVFNLASQPNNNVVYIKGNFIQTAGSITETSNGLPAIELNGTSNQNIQMAGTVINSVDFRINNNAGVSLLSGLSLPYNLNLINGIVNTQAFFITLQAGCSIQADSLSNNSFVNGPLRKEGLSAATHFLFPVGKAITQRWIELKNVNGSYTVEFFKANPNTLASAKGIGIHHISSIEYWSVQADASPLSAAAIELSFDNVNSGGVTDMATLRVAQLISDIWTDKGNIATTGTAGSAGSVISNSLDVFDAGSIYFTLASSDAFQNPLPLRLLSFNSNAYGNTIILRWMIAGSWQPAYFELQASSDGDRFIKLSDIEAVNNQVTYQYTDKRELSGKQYYRLKAVEKDGLFFYIYVQVAVNTIMNKPMQLHPSIVRTNATLLVDASVEKNIQIIIYNLEGRAMQIMKEFVHAGNNTVRLQLSSLSAGVYILSVTGAGDKPVTVRFIKLE